jgi:flavodoxin
MRIGIIFHSVDGNTCQVAQALRDAFLKHQHDTELVRIEAVGDDPDETTVTISEHPDLSAYDRLVFAAPVHLFNVSRVMRAYLDEIAPVDGKPTAILVTHHFPFSWMGGTRALRSMRRKLIRKKANLTDSLYVNRNSTRRNLTIDAVCARWFV